MGAEKFQLEPVTDLDAIQREWSELADASGNVYASWESHDIWWRLFGAGRPLLVTACRNEDGALAAIVPLYEATRRPVRVLRFLGHGCASHTGPITARGNQHMAGEALGATLRARLWPWDTILGDDVPVRGGWRERLGGQSWWRRADPILRIEGASWEEYLQTRSPNLRQQIRRHERNLLTSHDVITRILDDPGRLADDFATLVRLHDSRWDGKSGALRGQHGEFHRQFAAAALTRGWLRLWIMEVDGAPAAAWYGFRFGGADWYRQAGRDPKWEHEHVGFVLTVQAIRSSFEDRMREYRFLPGDEAYKARFANDDPQVERVAIARGLRGRVALRAAEFVVRDEGRRALGRRLTGIRPDATRRHVTSAFTKR